jgi:hypothetical protein
MNFSVSYEVTGEATADELIHQTRSKRNAPEASWQPECQSLQSALFGFGFPAGRASHQLLRTNELVVVNTMPRWLCQNRELTVERTSRPE